MGDVSVLSVKGIIPRKCGQISSQSELPAMSHFDQVRLATRTSALNLVSNPVFAGNSTLRKESEVCLWLKSARYYCCVVVGEEWPPPLESVPPGRGRITRKAANAITMMAAMTITSTRLLWFGSVSRGGEGSCMPHRMPMLPCECVKSRIFSKFTRQASSARRSCRKHRISGTSFLI